MRTKPKRKKFFKFVKFLMKPFIKKLKIVNYNKSGFEEGSIILSNHVGASAPLALEFNLPCDFRFWGTYEMCFGIKDRWRYLYRDYFMQKKHNKKFSAWLKATVSAPFVGAFYKGLQLIPTYRDLRLKSTLETTLGMLKRGQSVVIFPENSSDGYHDILTEYYGGFYLLAKKFYEKYGRNVKIYNMYYLKKRNTLIVDKAITVKELIAYDISHKEVAEKFRVRANEMRAEEENKYL